MKNPNICVKNNKTTEIKGNNKIKCQENNSGELNKYLLNLMVKWNFEFM